MTRKKISGRGYIITIYIVGYIDEKQYCEIGEVSGGVTTPYPHGCAIVYNNSIQNFKISIHFEMTFSRVW